MEDALLGGAHVEACARENGDDDEDDEVVNVVIDEAQAHAKHVRGELRATESTYSGGRVGKGTLTYSLSEVLGQESNVEVAQQ